MEQFRGERLERCPYCGGGLFSTERDRVFCSECGTLISDHHAPPSLATGQAGTDGTPQTNLSIRKDKNGQERVAGALWLDRQRQKSRSSRG